MRLVAPVLVLATGCNQLLGVPEVDHSRCGSEVAFARLAPVGGLEGGFGAQSAQLSRDELTIVFSRLTIVEGPGEPVARHGDLFIAHRDHRTDDFHDAVALDELNTNFDELSASLSGDQQTLYFDQRGPSQRYRIFAATRSASRTAFEPPMALELDNGASSDLEPFLTSSALYFASRRSDGSASLFSATGHGTSFSMPGRLTSLEIMPPPSAYENPVVSSDDLTIYFSAPPDNATPPDIWRASRSDRGQPFGTPHAVGELNSISVDRPTWLSEDSCRLYFVTNRTGQGVQLWMASRSSP